MWGSRLPSMATMRGRPGPWCGQGAAGQGCGAAGCGRPWLGRCVALEAAAGRGRGMAGCGLAAACHGRPGLGLAWACSKTKYRNVEHNENKMRKLKKVTHLSYIK
jgi:hypothetical protein